MLAENLQKQQKILSEQLQYQQAALERQQHAISQPSTSISTQQQWQPGCFGCGSRTHMRRDYPGNQLNCRGGSNRGKRFKNKLPLLNRKTPPQGYSGGSEPQRQNGTPIHMIGGTLTVQAKLGGVDVLCVVDSGSMISFMTEEFCEKKLQPTCGHVKNGQIPCILLMASRFRTWAAWN